MANGKSYARITVTFDNGSESTQIVEYGAGTLDRAAHHIQDEARTFWDGWKRPIGVTYRALRGESLVDALIEGVA